MMRYRPLAQIADCFRLPMRPFLIDRCRQVIDVNKREIVDVGYRADLLRYWMMGACLLGMSAYIGASWGAETYPDAAVTASAALPASTINSSSGALGASGAIGSTASDAVSASVDKNITPSKSLLPQGFATEDAIQQSDWLMARSKSGALQKADDAQWYALIQALSPEALVDYMRAGIAPLDSYQFEMTRWERHGGQWPSRPDHMLVRYEDSPRRIYVRWLADGKHAGQEILYDERQDAGHIVGHFGGLLKFASISFPIDGVIAHTQSAHSVRDLGLQFAIRMLEHDLASYHEEGLDGRPTRVAIVHDGAMRLIALTWTSSTGPPAHYASRVQLSLDLQHPWPREVASWDQAGVQQERIIFDHVDARQWDADTFDRKNPAYGF